MRAPCVVIALAACGGGEGAPPVDAPPALDAIADQWTEPTLVDPEEGRQHPALSSDRRALYFTNYHAERLYVATRASIDDAWSVPETLPFEVGRYQVSPRLSADDRTLYFASDGTSGNADIWRATRTTTSDPWGAPELVAALSSDGHDMMATPCAGGARHVFLSDRDGAFAIYEHDGATARRLGELDAIAALDPFVLESCLTLYVSGGSPYAIYVSRRASVDDAWGAPERLDELAHGFDDRRSPWVSPDEDHIVFTNVTFPDRVLLEAFRL